MTNDPTATAELQFRVLGPLEVRCDGATLAIGPPKQRALLAVLLSASGAAVPIDQLVDELWPNRPPSSAATNVRGYAAALRRALPAPEQHRLAAARRGYLLHAGHDEVDAGVFQSLAADGRAALDRNDPATADLLLGRALDLWRGSPFENLEPGTELAATAGRLEDLRLVVQEDRFDALLALGGHGELVPALRRMVAAYPMRERGWQQLALALYRSGDPAGALDACQRARAALAEELGLEPGPELRRLHRAILNRDTTLAPSRAAGTGSPVPTPRQLPPAPDPLVGRDEELAAITRVLTGDGVGPRVVAISGRVGVGKTALALAVAHRCAGHYPDGQLHAEVGGAPADVLATFLRALGDRDPVGPDPAELVARFRSLVAGQRLLFVLDGVEHDGHLATLLPAGAGCGVIVTGRRVCGTVAHARRFDLGPLPVAAALDLLRCYAGPDRVDADEAAARAVVRECDGLPLAVRLAAARLAGDSDRPVAALAHRLADDRRLLDELDIDGALRSRLHGAVPADHPAAAHAFRQTARLDRTGFTARRIAAAMGSPVAVAQAALDRLASARLVTAVGETSYRVHRLERLFAADLPPEVPPTTASAGPGR
jgi:DNA-binding SARP family transcriptional activator